MTNQTDLVRVKVRLNQVISNGTGGPGSNVPTGLTMTNNGSLVTTAPGTITVGNHNFSLESPITKDVTTPWEAGSNNGGLLTSTSEQTEKLNAFVISTGVVYDIAFTFDDTPTLPTGYNLYAKIGHVLLNEGAITELWPTKDLGTSWVDNDIYTAINETNTRVTANSEELTNVKADIVDINTSVEGLDTATSEIQSKIPAEASDTNQLADKAFVNAEMAKNQAALDLKADKSDTYTKTEVDTFVAEQETNLTTVKNDLGDLGDQVSVIEAKIPSAASETNQLADKQFVQDLTSALNFVKWVDTLPETGESKYIYAVPREETDTDGKPIAALYLWDGSAWRGAGAFSLNIDPDTLATKAELAGYLPLSGGALTGDLSTSSNKGKIILSVQPNSNPSVSLKNSAQTLFLNQEGGTLVFFKSYSKRVILSGDSGNVITDTKGVLLGTADKSVANGVASLDENAKVPAAQIPVDGTTITVNAEGNLVSAGGSGGDAMAVVKLTQAEYDALNPKDPSTIYAIKMEEE